MPKGRPNIRRGLPRKLEAALALGKDAILQFVFENSHPIPFSGCWAWTGPTQERGYGYLVDPRKPFNRASAPRMIIPRLVCETVHGAMPDDWQTRHQCHTPICVNPDHLLPGTRSDNLKDSVRDGRWTFTRGTGNGRAKLNGAKVLEIQRLHHEGISYPQIAAVFGVGTSTASRAVRGQLSFSLPGS